jgi:hypothetical protein
MQRCRIKTIKAKRKKQRCSGKLVIISARPVLQTIFALGNEKTLHETKRQGRRQERFRFLAHPVYGSIAGASQPFCFWSFPPPFVV